MKKAITYMMIGALITSIASTCVCNNDSLTCKMKQMKNKSMDVMNKIME